ncbi:DNA recombination protein RmuC [Piscinibacter sakaiensis]|uniref:DNA recombination protein RmuC n=1 Tax=Piscinibacter sakaiensis TaxID=1547922 RepID=UPI003AAD151B
MDPELGQWLFVGLATLNLLLVAGLYWKLRDDRAADRRSELQTASLLDAHRRDAEHLERNLRGEIDRSASASRVELGQTLSGLQQTLLHQQGEVARLQNDQLDQLRIQLAAMQTTVAEAVQSAAQRQHQQAQQSREAQDNALQRFAASFNEQLRALSDANERRLSEVRATVEQRLASLQQGNENKLEQMRLTVDEKLHATLEQRLGDSFKQVAERLEQVHRGLGEMQLLAKDVGSLNRVLTNVKSRGIFGEVQLAGLLEQVFTPEQFASNVETVPGSGARVEFALKLPGRRDDGAPLWLPIDAKFPREDHERLLDAQERADSAGAETAARAIEQRLRLEARSIAGKYLAPPHTTDFAILFVPTEGLYAEALRRPGLVEGLQRDHKVMLAGPTTLLATLNCLQMGFRTLALEKRSAEVWEVLGGVKTEFAKFADVLAKTRKKLEEAANTIEHAQTRTRVMSRKLKSVEALSDTHSRQLLPELFDETIEATDEGLA